MLPQDLTTSSQMLWVLNPFLFQKNKPDNFNSENFPFIRASKIFLKQGREKRMDSLKLFDCQKQSWTWNLHLNIHPSMILSMCPKDFFWGFFIRSTIYFYYKTYFLNKVLNVSNNATYAVVRVCFFLT